MASRTLFRAFRPLQSLNRLPATFPPPHQSARSRFPVTPLALLAAAPFFVTYAESAPDPFPFPTVLRTEHDTGVEFPTSLSSTQQLSGIGARLMRGLVKVYAVGVYFDPQRARAELSDWSGFRAAEIAISEPLWRTFCAAERIPSTVRMVVVRQVVGTHMQHGMQRQLIPRSLQAAKRGGCRPADCKADANRFCALFKSVGTMKVGSEVLIALDGDVVSLTVDGRHLGEVKSKQLCWAIMDMFVGEKSVVKGLRDDIARGLEQVLG